MRRNIVVPCHFCEFAIDRLSKRLSFRKYNIFNNSSHVQIFVPMQACKRQFTSTLLVLIQITHKFMFLGGDGDVGSARYELALPPQFPTAALFSYCFKFSCEY